MIKKESIDSARQKSSSGGTNSIQSSNVEDPLTCLLPDLESDDEVKLVSMVDKVADVKRLK